MAESDDTLGFSVEADTSALDDAQAQTLRFLNTFEQNVAQAGRGIPPLSIPVDLDNLGAFRTALRSVRGDADAMRQAFQGFSAGVQAEFSAVGISGADVSRIINVLWNEVLHAAEAADRAQAPIASLASGLAGINSLLAAPRVPLEIGAGPQVAQVRLLSSGLQEVEAELIRIRQIGTALRAQPLLPTAQPVRGLIGPAGNAGATGLPTAATSAQIATLSSGLQGYRNAAAEAQAATDRLRAVMLSEGQAARRLAGDNESAAAAIGALGAQSARTTAAHEKHAEGARKAQSAILLLGGEAVGLTGPLGRLAEALLLLGPGSAVALGVAGGLAIIGGAYEFFTKQTREAEKATDDFIAAQVRAARAQNPTQTVREAFAGVDEADRHVEGITAQMARLNEELTKAARGVEVFDRATGGITFVVDDAAVAKIKQQIADLKTASEQTGRDFLGPLIAARAAATQQGISDRLTAEQQGIAAQEAQLQAFHAQDLVSTQEFYAQRRALAVQAAAADVQALQSQLTTAQNAPARTDAEKVAQRGTIDHLREQIALRQRILDQQTDAIENEAELARQLLFEKAGFADIQTVNGPVAQLQPDASVQQRFGTGASDLKLKPSLDLSEVEAGLDRFAADTSRFQAENAFEDARLAGEKFTSLLEERTGPIIRQIGLDLEDIGNANLTGPNVFQNFLRDAQGFLDVLGEAGNAFDLLGEQGNRTLSALGGAFRAFATGDILGGVASVFSGFGPTQQDLDLQRAQDANTEALRRATAAYESSLGRFQGVGGIAEQRAVVAQIAGSDKGQEAILNAANAFDKFTRDAAFEDLQDAVRGSGLTLKELEDIADSFGVTLVKNGELVDGAFDALQQQLDLAAKAAIGFSNTLSDQIDQRELRARLAGGVGDAQDVFGRELDALKQVAPKLAEQFSRIDLGDVSAVRRKFLELFDDFASHALDPSILGGLSDDDFKRFLEDGANFLDDFDQGLQAATKSLQNVPDFFALGEAEFSARQTGTDGAQLPLGPLPPVNVPPQTGPRRQNFNPPLPVSVSTDQRTLVYVTGPINLHFQEAPKNPDELARAVRSGAMRAALATTGREDDPNV